MRKRRQSTSPEQVPAGKAGMACSPPVQPPPLRKKSAVLLFGRPGPAHGTAIYPGGRHANKKSAVKTGIFRAKGGIESWIVAVHPCACLHVKRLYRDMPKELAVFGHGNDSATSIADRRGPRAAHILLGEFTELCRHRQLTHRHYRYNKWKKIKAAARCPSGDRAAAFTPFFSVRAVPRGKGRLNEDGPNSSQSARASSTAATAALPKYPGPAGSGPCPWRTSR